MPFANDAPEARQQKNPPKHSKSGDYQGDFTGDDKGNSAPKRP